MEAHGARGARVPCMQTCDEYVVKGKSSTSNCGLAIHCVLLSVNGWFRCNIRMTTIMSAGSTFSSTGDGDVQT